MTNFLALLRKEMIQLFKNPKSRFTVLLPPVIQILIFGYAATMDLRRIDYAVLDHDRSTDSRKLIAMFDGSGIFRRAAWPAGERELYDLIGNRRLLLGLVIPQNFARNVEAGASPVQILTDGRNSNTSGLAMGYAQNTVERFNREYRRDNAIPNPGFELETRAWFNVNFNMRYFMIPALLALLTLTVIMLLSAMSLAREREEGTFDQLMVAPYDPWQVLCVKGISCVIVGLLQATLVLLVGLWWFEVPLRGSLALLYLGFGAFLAASTGIGMVISVLCRTLQQAMLGTFLLAVPCGLLSGMSTPIESMPDFLQYLTYFNPMRYGIKLTQQLMLEGAGMDLLWPYFAAMLGIATGAYLLAWIVFRRQLRG